MRKEKGKGKGKRNGEGKGKGKVKRKGKGKKEGEGKGKGKTFFKKCLIDRLIFRFLFHGRGTRYVFVTYMYTYYICFIFR